MQYMVRNVAELLLQGAKPCKVLAGVDVMLWVCKSKVEAGLERGPLGQDCEVALAQELYGAHSLVPARTQQQQHWHWLLPHQQLHALLWRPFKSSLPE
jgi:hypothetical protein